MKIDTMINNLNWDMDYDTQKQTIGKFVERHFIEHDLFEIVNNIIQSGQKGKWENVVKIIELIGFPSNHIYIFILFELLQDLNWPGSEDAMKVLNDIEPRELVIFIEKYLDLAMNSKDFIWISGIKRLVEMSDIQFELSYKSMEILKNADY